MRLQRLHTFPVGLPFSIKSFSAYKSAVAAALSPLIGPEARGLELRLQVSGRHIDIVVFVVTDDETCDAQSLRTVAAGIPDRFEEFAGFSTSVVVERAESVGPLVYRGCPVWARAGTQWQLAPDLKSRIEAARVERVERVERVDSRPGERV
ncbi:MAG: hypothetical protein ACREOK_13965 [Gemmatimonadaceae bacterium]